MTTELWTNNATGTLASSITSAATSLTLVAGQGALFPSPTGGDYFWATIQPPTGAIEIVKCTARVGDTLTVVRAQQGTVASAFTAGALFELRLTAATLEMVSSGVNVKSDPYGAVGNGVADDTAAIQAAIDSGATAIYFPAGTYKVTSTILVSQKVGLHIFGDSGGSNGLGSSKIYWAGAANGTVFQLYSSSNCTIERLAIQGILGGVPTNPGAGINVTGLNASGGTNGNVFRDCSVSAIGGTPGYGILIGSATNDDIGRNTFENILIVGGAIGVVQFGNQTVLNNFRNVQMIDYTSKGMTFIDGDVRLRDCSFFGLPASATIDCEVGTACLWAEIRDSYHEIYGARPVGTQAYGFTSGARAWETTLDGCRVLWDIASGYVIKYEQRGPLTLRGLTVDVGVGGVGNFLLANGAATPQPLVRTGNHIAATITQDVTGAWDYQQATAHQLSVPIADFAGGDVSTAQPWFTAAQDTVTLAASTTYAVEALLMITRAAGAVAHTTGFLLGGTATFTSLALLLQATTSTGAPTAATTAAQLFTIVATETVFTASSTAATENITLLVSGHIRVNGAGTVIPQFKYSAAPGGAPTILKNSYFRLTPLGSDTVGAMGAWA